MTKPLKRAKEIYTARGHKELFRRLVQQIRFQFLERVFGSLLYFRLQYIINSLWYDTVQNPYEIRFIDPGRVEYRSARAVASDQSRWKHIGVVLDGEWDQKSKTPEYTIENELLYQAIEAHFERDVPWEKTEYVQKSLERLKQDDHEDTWRAVVRSEADLWERCEQIDELYDRIQESGYNTKREVFEAKSDDPMGYYPRTFKFMIDEVMIDIGRDGEPLLVDGQHRLFIAKMYGIKEIPVLTVVRHREYVDGR